MCIRDRGCGGSDLRLVCHAPVHGFGLRGRAGTRCDHAAALSPPAGEARAGPDAVRGPERDFRPAGLDHARGSIVDATIIAAPSSTKNATGTRDPAMRQTKKGNQWFFGMKAHIGTDAGTGYVHSVT